jgi:hypothetical protein
MPTKFTSDLELLDDYEFVTWLLHDHDRDASRYGLSKTVTRNLRPLYEEYRREHDQEAIA